VEATVKLDEWPGPDWQGAGDMSVETRNGGAAKSCGKNCDLMFFFMKHDDLLVKLPMFSL